MASDIETTTGNPVAESVPSDGIAATKPVDEKKSASTEQSEDEITEASETSEENLPENEGEDESEESESDDKEEGKKKKKKGFKNRIDKLRTKLSAKDQQIALLQQELSKGQSQPNLQPPEAKKPETSTDAGRPNADNFESHEAYVEAVADWKYEQRETARKAQDHAEQLKSEYQKQLDSHNSRVTEFQKAQPDYTEVVQEFIEDHGDIKFSPALEEAIVTSDLGPALLYELMKSPEELLRINALGYGAAQRAIGRFETRLEKSSESQKEIKTKLTTAPPPPNPVGSKGTTVKRDLSTMEYDDYVRERREQMKQSRR